MKLKFYTEQVLTVLLVVILLPCAITLLLNSRMSRIYQAIQDETKYISIESGDKTEEISLEEYVLEVTASELPADAQLEAIKAQMVLVRTNAYRQLQNGGIRPKERMSLAEIELMRNGDAFRKAQKETKGEIFNMAGETDSGFLSSGQCRADKRSKRSVPVRGLSISDRESLSGR